MNPIKFSEIVRRIKESTVNDDKKPVSYNPTIHRLLQKHSQEKSLIVFKSRRVGMTYIKDFEMLMLKSKEKQNKKTSFIADDWETSVASDACGRACDLISNPAKALFSFQTYLRAL